MTRETAKKDYCFNAKLDATGEYVNILYRSSHRHGTESNLSDLMDALRKNSITVSGGSIFYGKLWKRNFYSIYLLNKKNKENECFDDYRTIDLR